MTLRERFLDAVQNGGKPICSPQIGAGAGFDTRLAGKEWVTQTTLEDTLNAVARFDIVPLLNIGCDYESKLPHQWRCAHRDEQPDKVSADYVLETPAGTLTRQIVETRKEGCFQPKYAVTGEEDLPAMEYCIDMLLDADFSAVTTQTRSAVDQIAGRGALSVQWAAQPYELMCFANTVDTVLLHNDQPERCLKMMEKIVEIDRRLFRAVADGGADFIFLGGPAAEMVSPSIYRRLILPYSQIVSAAAHECGLKVYSHICSPIEPFLTMGFYNQMGIDLFETLSPPPVGNVKSLKDAFTKLDSTICTRGNIGLDVLLNGSVEDVRRKTIEALEACAGRKHMVAASDYLFYNTPEENVRAMADTVREYTQN